MDIIEFFLPRHRPEDKLRSSPCQNGLRCGLFCMFVIISVFMFDPIMLTQEQILCYIPANLCLIIPIIYTKTPGGESFGNKTTQLHRPTSTLYHHLHNNILLSLSSCLTISLQKILLTLFMLSSPFLFQLKNMIISISCCQSPI